VRSFAVIAVNAWRDAVCHDMLTDALQLILRAILQVEESIEANLFTLKENIKKETRLDHTQIV